MDTPGQAGLVDGNNGTGGVRPGRGHPIHVWTNGRAPGLIATIDTDGHVEGSALAPAPRQPAPPAPAELPPGPEPTPAGARRAEAPSRVSPTRPTRQVEWSRPIVRLLRMLTLLALALVALGAATTVGYRWYEDSITYVSTDNAQVAGAMIQVGGLAAGRVQAIRYDVGDQVRQNDVIAQLTVPIALSMLPNGVPNQQFIGTSDTVVDVRSPVSGMIVARSANPGDAVQAGQALLTVVDPSRLWVTANVEETQARKLAVGQPVQVHVDNLDADLSGRVAAVAQASAQSFSPLPQQNLSGNYTKVTQLQPVKIWLDGIDPRLALGTSVEVKIRVLN